MNRDLSVMNSTRLISQQAISRYPFPDVYGSTVFSKPFSQARTLRINHIAVCTKFEKVFSHLLRATVSIVLISQH